jgi:hypothetical protein
MRSALKQVENVMNAIYDRLISAYANGRGHLSADDHAIRIAAARSPILVTLVHGTFDCGARWTKPDSEICRKLSLSVGEHLYVLPFEWSGKNSERARALAVNQLIDHLAAQQSYFPTSPHFLIGHSHGGNIVKQALGHAEKQRNRISGVVTISTPFIRYNRRKTFGALSQIFWVWTVLLAATSFLWTLYILGLLIALIRIPFVPLILLVASFLLGPLEYLLIQAHLEKVRKRIEATIKKRQDILLRQTYAPLLCPFLCISTPTDEVNLIFKGAYFTTLGWRAAKGLGKAFQKIGNSEFVTSMIGFLTVSYGIFCFFVIIGNATGNAPSWSLTQSLVFPAVLVAVVLSLGIPISVILALALFGTPSVQDTLAITIQTSMRPDGVTNVQFLSVSPIAAIRAYFARRNAHTHIMYSEMVAEEIAKFVSKYCGVRNRKSVDVKT